MNSSYVSPILPENFRTPTKIYRKKFKGIGVSEIVFGVLCVLLGVVALAFPLSAPAFYSYTPLHFIGDGIWGGGIMVISGSLAVCHGKKPSKYLAIAGTVFCLLALISSLAIAGIEVAASSVISTVNGTQAPVLIAVHVSLAAFGTVEIGLTIAHFIFCCKALNNLIKIPKRDPVQCFYKPEQLPQMAVTHSIPKSNTLEKKNGNLPNQTLRPNGPSLKPSVWSNLDGSNP